MARSTEIWLGDLLRACAELAPNEDAASAICRLLGLDALPPKAGGATRSESKGSEFKVPDDDLREEEPRLKDTGLPRPRDTGQGVRLLFTLEPGPPRASTAELPAWFADTPMLQARAAPPPRPPQPLLPRLQRRAILATALGCWVAEGKLDLAPVIRTLSHGLPLRAFPRKSRRTLRYGVEVVVDRAPWLAPFEAEQQALIAYLRTLFPADRLCVRLCRASPTPLARGRRPLPAPRPDPQAAVLALTDLGAGFRQLDTPPPDLQAWQGFARALRRQRRPAVALQPFPPSRWPLALGRDLPMLHWNEHTSIGDAARLSRGIWAPPHRPGDAPSSIETDVLRLARLLSPAVRIDPWLLREARRRFLPKHDASLEAELWFSPLVASRSSAGIVLATAALADLRQGLLAHEADHLPAALRLVADAHTDYPDTLRLEERLLALALSGQLDDDAVTTALQPALKTLASSSDQSDEVATWAAHAWTRFPSALQATESARQLAFGSAARLRRASWLRTGNNQETPAFPIDVEWLLRAQQLGTTDLTVELHHYDDSLELRFEAPQPAQATRHPLCLPATSPLWLQIVEAGDSPHKTLAAAPGEGLRLSAGTSRNGVELSLFSLTGEYWRLSTGQPPSRLLADSLPAPQPAPNEDAAAPPYIVVIAPGLGLAWPDEGKAGTSIHLADSGRHGSATRLGALPRDDGLAISVLRLNEDADSSPWRPLDLSGRSLSPPFNLNPADQGVIGVGRNTDGKLQDHILHRAANNRYLSPDTPAGDAQAGLLVPTTAGGEWALLFPAAQRRSIQLKSAARGGRTAVPLAPLVSAAASLAQQRWRVFISHTQTARDDADVLHAELLHYIDAWRICHDTGRLPAGGDWQAELSKSLRNSEIVLLIGDYRLSKWAQWELSVAQELGLPLIWIKPAEGASSAEPPPFSPALVIPLERQRLDAAAAKRIAARIAAFRLPPPPGTAAPDNHDQAQPGLLQTLKTSIARRLSQQLEKDHPAPGLYRLSLNGVFALHAFVTPRESVPLLILIPGLASSGEATFGSLWDATASDERQRLRERYGEQVFSFEYHGVSRSPVSNALLLAQALPAGAQLHLLTHSAGGLIGELFARAERDDGSPPFDDQDLTLITGALGGAAGEELRQLSRLLVDKRFHIERFVRVACPARGTRIFSESPRQAIELMNGAAALLNPIVGLAGNAVSSALRILQDPQAMPGFALQSPESPLITLLNRHDVTSTAPLFIVAGVRQAEGLLARAFNLAARTLAFDGADNDLLTNLDSTRGGVLRNRPPDEFIDRGEDVDHFSYFSNARTREVIVAALTHAPYK